MDVCGLLNGATHQPYYNYKQILHKTIMANGGKVHFVEQRRERQILSLFVCPVSEDDFVGSWGIQLRLDGGSNYQRVIRNNN